MIIMFTYTSKGFRQYIPFMDYYEKNSIDYVCFYRGELTDHEGYNVVSGNIKTFVKLLRKVTKFNSSVDLICYSIFNLIRIRIISKMISNNIKVIYRARGISPEESYIRNNNLLRYKLIGIIERIGLLISDEILCVSNNQKKHFEKKYNIRKDKMVVLHNFLNQWQYKCFDRCGNNDIEIVYSGSFSKWQKIEEVFSIVNKVQEHIPDIRFLVCTNVENNSKFMDLADAFNISNFKIENYSNYDLLVDRLRKASVGIIFRDNNKVNTTASPFKVIDYFVSAIPIIMTKNIGDYDTILGHEEFIFQINLEKEGEIEELVRFLKKSANCNPLDVLEFARENLDFSKELGRYLNGRRVNNKSISS